MVKVERTLEVSTPVEKVLTYLKDFGNATEWDPGTVSCERLDEGAIAVGSVWQNTSKFLGRETQLRYELTILESGHLRFVGVNKTATSTDDIEVRASGGGAGFGSEITYHASIDFKGAANLASPVLKVAFERIAEKTVRQMTEALSKLE